MSKSGVSLSHLRLTHCRGGEQGVKLLLKENVNGRVRVTSSTKIEKIATFFDANDM